MGLGAIGAPGVNVGRGAIGREGMGEPGTEVEGVVTPLPGATMCVGTWGGRGTEGICGAPGEAAETRGADGAPGRGCEGDVDCGGRAIITAGGCGSRGAGSLGCGGRGPGVLANSGGAGREAGVEGRGLAGTPSERAGSPGPAAGTVGVAGAGELGAVLGAAAAGAACAEAG